MTFVSPDVTEAGPATMPTRASIKRSGRSERSTSMPGATGAGTPRLFLIPMHPAS